MTTLNDDMKNYYGPDGSTDGAKHTEPNQLAGERNIGTSNQYFASVPECNYHPFATADNDTIITSSPALLFGVLVTAATTGAIEIRDGTTAAGALVLTIPTGTAIGTFFEMKGGKCNDGLFIDDASTVGSLNVMWRDQ